MSAQRHHFHNTLVGHLDAAFCLTPAEKFATQTAIRDLLDVLDIPGRGQPATLASPLVAEVTNNFWSVQLDSDGPDPRTVDDTDIVVSLDAWRNALASLITTAYPTLMPLERILLAKHLDDLLRHLGVPGRAARFIPELVIPHHRDAEDL